MSPSLPVVICGLNDQIGGPVSELLSPEYEVIHFMKGLTAAQSEIPHLLMGHDPQPTHPNDVGTKNYSRPTRAVIFGRGFDAEDVRALREKVAGTSPDPVVWIACDPSRKPPPGTVLPPNYPQLVAGVLRKALDAWVEAGAAKDELVLY